MFRIDDDDIKSLEREIKTFAKRALPFATKNTLNKAAFEAQRAARVKIGAVMVTRNKWTTRSVRVAKTNTLNISQQESSVGSTEAYLEGQEFGDTKRKKGKEGVVIPTSYAAGQEGARPRKRLPRKAYKIQQIQLANRARAGTNKKQRLIVSAIGAVDSGRRFIFAEMKRKQGIFRVVGGRKGTKRGWPKGAKLKMVHDMTEQSVTIPRNPWLEPAFIDTQKMVPKIYRESLEFQLKRLGLFRGKK